MNVLILNHYHRLSPRVDLEVRSLQEAGYRVKVLNWDRAGRRSRANPDGDQTWVSLGAPFGKLSLLLSLPRLYWAMAQRVRSWKVDIIHCTHLSLLPLAILIARLKQSAVIYDVYERHSLDVASYFGLIRKPAKGFIEFIEDRMLAPHVQGVLTVDSPGSHLEKRYRKRNQNIAVLNNVPSLDSYPDSEEPGIFPAWMTGRRIMVYVGGLRNDKGLLTYIMTTRALVKDFPDLALLLIGDFENSETEALSLIDQCDLSEHVYIVPWLPYRRMISYCRRAEIALAVHQPAEKFLFVSKGTGRKFFTYMECGLPIVATNFAEVAQVVQEEKCGILVDSTDLDAVVGAVRYLLKRPDAARELGLRGRKAIEQKYNWEIESQKLLRVYSELSRGGQNGGSVTKSSGCTERDAR